MIKRIDFENSLGAEKVFIFDDTVYTTDEQIKEAMEVCDMGAIERGCVCLYKCQWNVIEQAVKEYKNEVTENEE